MIGMCQTSKEDMSGMVGNCISFNQSVEAWDISNVVFMYEMFAGCVVF